MKNYHFWYSEKQASVFGVSLSVKRRPINYATINGKIVLYTTCSHTTEHGCFFDDMVYLGQGDYAYAIGTW